MAGASNMTNNQGVFGGGYGPPSYGYTNVIDYVTISSTGDAADFGDLTQARSQFGACSNA